MKLRITNLRYPNAVFFAGVLCAVGAPPIEVDSEDLSEGDTSFLEKHSRGEKPFFSVGRDAPVTPQAPAPPAAPVGAPQAPAVPPAPPVAPRLPTAPEKGKGKKQSAAEVEATPPVSEVTSET